MLLPALFVAALLPDPARQGYALTGTAEGPETRAISCIAAVLAAALLALHSTAVVAAAEPAGAFASRAFTATVLDMPFAPRGDYLIWLMAEEPVFWTGALAGLVVAARQRAWSAVALSLRCCRSFSTGTPFRITSRS